MLLVLLLGLFIEMDAAEGILETLVVAKKLFLVLAVVLVSLSTWWVVTQQFARDSREDESPLTLAKAMLRGAFPRCVLTAAAKVEALWNEGQAAGIPLWPSG